MLCNYKMRKLFSSSIWIVPCETLLAYKTIGTISQAVNDQTVWSIDSYDNGYIFGTSYTSINGVPSSKTKIIGSITPNGDVLFSFSSSATLTSGYGKFIDDKEDNNKYKFIMQMNDLNTIKQGVIGLSHWSYMIKVTEGDPLYCHLPGSGKTVPEFIASFNNM